MNDRIEALPKPEGDLYPAFRNIHTGIEKQMKQIYDNQWIIRNLELTPQKQCNESVKYGAHTKKIMRIFKHREKIRFLKNFLRGVKCGHCQIRNKRLLMCKRCHKMRYCSKKCQKRHWLTHRKVCM
eukprot:551735_1